MASATLRFKPGSAHKVSIDLSCSVCHHVWESDTLRQGFPEHDLKEPAACVQFRRVLDQIRGRSYEEALMILEYLPYRAVEHILPTLMSVWCQHANQS